MGAEKPADSPIQFGLTTRRESVQMRERSCGEGAWRRTEASCLVLSIFKGPGARALRVEFEVAQNSVKCQLNTTPFLIFPECDYSLRRRLADEL